MRLRPAEACEITFMTKKDVLTILKPCLPITDWCIHESKHVTVVISFGATVSQRMASTVLLIVMSILFEQVYRYNGCGAGYKGQGVNRPMLQQKMCSTYNPMIGRVTWNIMASLWFKILSE